MEYLLRDDVLLSGLVAVSSLGWTLPGSPQNVLVTVFDCLMPTSEDFDFVTRESYVGILPWLKMVPT